MQYQIKENCLTIFLPAEVDHHNAEEIKREADKVIEEQHIKYVIFDFGRTSFMDSSGIGVIMGRYRHIFLLGGEVWAIHTSERMRQILNMSGVTKIIQIYEEGMMSVIHPSHKSSICTLGISPLQGALYHRFGQCTAAMIQKKTARCFLRCPSAYAAETAATDFSVAKRVCPSREEGVYGKTFIYTDVEAIQCQGKNIL